MIFTVGGAANGTVQLVDGHIARFTPGANFNNNRGSASFTYSVTDTGDGTAAAKTVGPIAISVSVTPVNDAPVTGDDSRAVANDEPTTINVLANDTDPDLVEGDTISIVSVTQGSRNGTVVIDNGKIVYTPVDLLGGEGTETFSYTIRDTVGLTATQVVTLTVVANSPPVAEPDTASTNEDAIIGGNVLTNDHDDDGNPLEVIAFDAVSAQGAAVTVAADGTFSYNPTGAAALQTLSNGELLDDTFTYTISDGQGGTAIGTVTVHVTGMNDAPTATAKTGATDEDTTLSKPAGFLLDGAHDPDAHDTLSINVGASDATSAKGAIVTIQADGSFVYDPTGSTVLQGLAQGQSTTDTFLFTVDDGNGGQYSAVVTITVTGLNDQPTARADSFQTNEDTPLVADETRNVLDNDTDPDTTDVLTVVGADSVSIQGAAVTVHADGTFSYNPGSLFNHLAVGESAQDTFSYTMSDGHVTKTATVTVTITGVNDEPTAVADSAATGKSTVINIDVVDNDTDPDTSDVLVVGTFAPTSTLRRHHHKERRRDAEVRSPGLGAVAGPGNRPAVGRHVHLRGLRRPRRQLDGDGFRDRHRLQRRALRRQSDRGHDAHRRDQPAAGLDQPEHGLRRARRRLVEFHGHEQQRGTGPRVDRRRQPVAGDVRHVHDGPGSDAGRGHGHGDRQHAQAEPRVRRVQRDGESRRHGRRLSGGSPDGDPRGPGQRQHAADVAGRGGRRQHVRRGSLDAGRRTAPASPAVPARD